MVSKKWFASLNKRLDQRPRELYHPAGDLPPLHDKSCTASSLHFLFNTIKKIAMSCALLWNLMCVHVMNLLQQCISPIDFRWLFDKQNLEPKVMYSAKSTFSTSLFLGHCNRNSANVDYLLRLSWRVTLNGPHANTAAAALKAMWGHRVIPYGSCNGAEARADNGVTWRIMERIYGPRSLCSLTKMENGATGHNSSLYLFRV